MSKTLEITIEKAHNAYKNASKEGKSLLTDLFGKDFINVNAADLIDTFIDVLSYNNMTLDQFNKLHADKTPDSYAYEQIKLIVLAYNGGVNVPLADTGYYPYFRKVASGRGLAFYVVYYDISFSLVGPRLWYKTEALAIAAGTKFESIYIDFFTK